ncbi:MAG: galactosyldiacylglycerol synthase [Acidobacteria bacterium]|nr:galactosyldiacylglycerol synthase [Acidobacteriota bacterium]
MQERPRKVDFVFFDAGGGHRAAATALKSVIEKQRGWDVRLVNFQEILDHLDIFRKISGIRLQDVYKLILKKGWTLGSPQMLVIMHTLIRLYHPAQVSELKKFWEESKPDMVVSVIPNFARALYQSLQAALPKTPLVTILTDLADYPPHFWMEPGQDQYWICGSERAVRQAMAMGYAREKVLRVSGMVLNPRFYEPVMMDRVAERRKLRLEPERPTGLILFGGQGSTVMESILQRLAEDQTAAQFIAICGKNDALRRRLSDRKWPMPVHVEGFTTEIPAFMHLSDFMIGKPGPGSLSEAMHMRLPAIVERNAWTLPQERYNAEWLTENETGLVLSSFRDVDKAVRQLLAGNTLDLYRANTHKLTNRAVFEIPSLLERIMEAGGSAT